MQVSLESWIVPGTWKHQAPNLAQFYLVSDGYGFAPVWLSIFQWEPGAKLMTP